MKGQIVEVYKNPLGDCTNSGFIDAVMDKAVKMSKKGKWANQLVRTGDWKDFDVKSDYATAVYRSNNYIVFEHSAIEYIYVIER